MAEHWCEIHKTKFFKTAKMSGYAHPVKNEDGITTAWCNEDAEEVAKLESQSSQELLPKDQEIIDEQVKPKPDPTRKSIERQTALKASVELGVAKLQAG